MQRKKKTVIFCGSFDPVHIGHAMIAGYVSQCGVADELWLTPSRVNPLKTDRPPVDDTHRIAMCQLVAARSGRIRVCDIESGLPLPSFTFRTLTCLRDRFPDREFILLIGSDNWLLFDRWRDYDKILSDFGILIYPRPGYSVDASSLPSGVDLMDEAPQALISSTFVRDSIREGRALDFFVPDEVLEYIKKHRLYG